MKEALERLFKPKQLTSIIASVEKRISSGKYEVKDDAERYFLVDASQEWSTGSRVTVQSGRIVGTAGKASTMKTFYV